MTALAVAFFAITALSYCTIRYVGRELRSPSAGSSIVLITVSIALLALWFVLNSYSPPGTIGEHWRMVGVALLGFFATLGPIASAIRNAEELRSFVIAVALIAIALAELLLATVSVPFS